MRTFFLLLFLSFTAHLSFAQGVSVSGRITDKITSQPVSFAQVLLVSLPDSTLKPVQTDMEGLFTFPDVAIGRYALKIQYLGYKPYRRVIQVAALPVNLGNITVEEDAKRLQEVEIVGRAATAVQKGDTSEFNSKAFKTNPDASAEDLVQKVPGVTMQDGKVQAQGEEVKKVLVDGKEFFGDDAAATLRNLPAEVIDKIQIFDQQSEQSKFSGFNDGNTTKTINIVTKPNMRNGRFGKVYAGAGTDNRYQAGGNINFMNGNRRLTIIGQTNNINQQNFSASDLLGVSSGGGQGGRGGRGGMGGRPGGGPGGNFGGGGGGASDFQVSTRNGVSKTHAFGLNYADKWGKKMDVTGSYFLNATDNLANQNVFREYVALSDSGQVYAERSRSDAMNINHRFNFRMEWEIDSMNSIRLTPRLTLQQNDGTSNLFGQTLSFGDFLNSTRNELKTDLLGYNFSSELLYRHRFAKRGRTFSASFNTDLSGNNGDRLLQAENQFFNKDSLQTELINQTSALETSGPTLGTNLTYTEPITDKSSLSVEYNASLRRNEADQKTYDYSEAEKGYTAFNPGLSNVFNSDYLTQQAGLGYRYSPSKDFMFVARGMYQYANLKSKQEFPFQTNINRKFNNVLPFAMVRYNLTKDKNLRLFYRTSTNAPSINQLQNVIDNSNPLLLTTGNPNLQQDYRHMLVTRYSAANPGKSTNFFAMISGEVADNYIANSTFIARKDTVLPIGIRVPDGGQLSRPDNLDGFFRIRSFVNYGMPLGFMKTNLNLNAGATFTRLPGMINNQVNYSNTQAYTAGIVLSSNISENLDFTLSTNPSYNLVENSLNTRSNNNYFNQNSSLRFNWIIWNGLFVQTDLAHQYYNGLAAGIDQNYLLWNAAIGKKLFKNNQGEIKLTGFDLLSQNNSIQRNITETYIEDVETNVLQRYFMVVFTYNLRAFGSGKAAPESSRPDGSPGMQGPPPGGMPNRPYGN
ncbi:TonB-dependent receptor [Adhaeribacter sp. BT258]|uniref:TonB-dependent receptor n=1 Tax=Adhaeribacter terrigena TaxID=2793070 RepID=A0ABS1BXX3_9BACT|nr:outer membrane beta-barrel protein [Adhaeribacter terrigena]MBK0401957.1 TonB-dependent receptor [Adhaeribacter terrigena]